MEYNSCGATLISSQYAVTALHCVAGAANNFEKVKEILPPGARPLDIFTVVAGAYYSRNYTVNSELEPEYEFQVSTINQILFITQ